MSWLQILDETGKGYEPKIKQLTNEFFTVENSLVASTKSVELKVPLSYYVEVYKNSTIAQQKHFEANGLTHKAVTILPTDERYSEFLLLFSEEVFVNLEYYSTIFHELTHLINYIEYFDDQGNVFVKDERSKRRLFYYEFYFWTEYHAKRNGLVQFKQELDKHNCNIDLKGSTSYFIQDTHFQKDMFSNLYALAHFLTRVSLYDNNGGTSLDETIFPKKYIKAKFGSEALTLYACFRSIKDYRGFKSEQHFIKPLIDSIL